MGLTTWAVAPEGKIVKSDVSVAKNYLSEKEMRSLERIVSAYLDLAEDRAERHIPMTMEDWVKRLDLFMMADDREVLQDAGKITAEIAKAKTQTAFEKYRVVQDRLFMSDFDKYMLELEENAKKQSMKPVMVFVAKVKLEFATETIEVEVSAEMYALHMELDRVEYNNNHRETRRSCCTSIK